MVGRNNGFQQSNDPVTDSYFRNVFEGRNSSQTALLPIVTFLVEQSEQSPDNRAILPYSIIESERDFLKALQEKYHKRPLRFEVSSKRSTESPVYDTLTKLIRKTRKYSDYAILDASDFLEKYPTLFATNEIPYSFSQTVTEVSQSYNHSVPSDLEHAVQEQPAKTPKQPKGLFQKALAFAPPDEQTPSRDQSILDVYSTVFNEITRHAIDFEVLKFYDFLVETSFQTIQSNKLLEIEPKLRKIGQQEYAKRRYKVTIRPLQTDQMNTTRDLVIDEWASNIRRGIELKESLQNDMKNLYTIYSS